MASGTGAGSSPLGTGAYGFGTPTTAPTPGGAINLDSRGRQLGSPMISLDPATKGQYVFDSFGRRVGEEDVPHLITLASLTLKQSCVVQDLGQRFFETEKITDTFQAEQETRVQEAFGGLVSRGLIRIEKVITDGSTGHPAKTHVILTDLTNNKPIDRVL